MPTAAPLRFLVYASVVIAAGAVIWMLTSVLDRVHTVLTVIVFSILFSYLIYPPVKWLSRRMPTALAVVVVYVGLAVVLLLGIAYVAPTLAAQAADLGRNYPATLHDVQAQIAHPTTNPLLARFPAQVRDAIAHNAGRAGEYVGVAAAAVGTQTLGILQGSFAFITAAALVFGLTSFFISDLEQIQETMLRMFPHERRPLVVSLMDDFDRVIGGFVRGQVLLAVGVAIAATLILAVLGVQYAVLLGIITGLISIVPIVGAIVGVLPAFIVALFTISVVKALIVLALFVVVLQVQANVLAPLVNARSVGVSPLVVFVALIVGSEAYGILGTLLAIPVAGIVRVVYERVFPYDPRVKSLVLTGRRHEADVPPPGPALHRAGRA